MGPYQILTSVNGPLTVTNLVSIGSTGVQSMSNPPIGAVNGSATGELGLKVVIAGSTTVAGGGIAVTPTAQAVTPTTTTSTTAVVIPSGSKGWTATVLTGTATFGSAAGLPAGFSDSDTNTLAVSLTITPAASSSVYVRYNT